MAGADASERGPVHGRPGHRDRERRVALDQDRPRVLPGEPPVGDQRLRPLLRRLPAPGRAGGRSTRSAAALPRRHRPVHPLLVAGGPGLVGGVADRGALVPGARRGGGFPRRAVAAPGPRPPRRGGPHRAPGRTIGVFAASLVLLVGFVLWERRHAEPLMRFAILRTKTVAGANVGGLILGTATFSMFLMLTLYMQQVLGYSPMKTGVAYLAVAGGAILWSAVAAHLLNPLGVKPVLPTRGGPRSR